MSNSRVDALLDGVVLSEIERRVKHKQLFTALDIFNSVKDSGFQCRHRDVAEIVRKFFRESHDVFSNYTNASIPITKLSGDSDEALLYYPDTLTFADLDVFYDQSKRSQSAKPPVSKIAATVKLATSHPKVFASMIVDKIKGLLPGSSGQGPKVGE